MSTEGTTLRSAPRGLTGADRLPRHLFGALFTSHVSAERTTAPSFSQGLLQSRKHHLAIRPQLRRGMLERFAILLHGRQHHLAIRPQLRRGKVERPSGYQVISRGHGRLRRYPPARDRRAPHRQACSAAWMTQLVW